MTRSFVANSISVANLFVAALLKTPVSLCTLAFLRCSLRTFCSQNRVFNTAAKTLLLLTLSACTTPEKLTLEPQGFDNLEGWQSTNHSRALSAFNESCAVMMKRKLSDNLGPQMGQVRDWKPACETAANVPNQPEATRVFFENYFSPLKSISSKRPDGLFTGYYEIELKGSLKPTRQYKYPLYRKPPEDLQGYTRAEINEGALEGRGLELLWVEDPVRLFFLHIQGSGMVRLQNGKIVRVGYDGQNGKAYISLGRWLIDNNYMTQEEVDAPAIKQWLYDHPDMAQSAMEQNPSYIYFRRRDDLSHADGPIGAQNVPLTPYHSIAIDKRFYGYGIPMWIETTLPNGNPFHQLTIAQDTGGAIRGAIRADVFYGRGKMAETLAGYMNQRGNFWVLLPKTLTDDQR